MEISRSGEAPLSPRQPSAGVAGGGGGDPQAGGIQALTLRAVARAAGVSHAAPTDRRCSSLLSELAAVGFRRFIVMLRTAAAVVGDDPVARARAMDRAYVDFARTHTGMFLLIFRKEQLDRAWPALREAGQRGHGSAARDRDRGGAGKGPGRPLAGNAHGRPLVAGARFRASGDRSAAPSILMNTPDIDVDDLLEIIRRTLSTTR